MGVVGEVSSEYDDLADDYLCSKPTSVVWNGKDVCILGSTNYSPLMFHTFSAMLALGLAQAVCKPIGHVVFLAKSHGQNGPHKNGEGGYASTDETMGAIAVVVGGLFTVFGFPQVGVPIMSWGAYKMGESTVKDSIDKYGR